MQHIDDLNRAIALLYETALSEAQWPDALRQIASAFGAFGVGHILFEGPTYNILDFRGHGHEQNSTRLYREHYYALDPGMPRVYRSMPGQWLPEDVMLPRSLVAGREYLNEYALPNGIGGVACGKVPIDSPYRTLVFSVQRRPGAAPFGQSSAQLFAILAPHLSAIARMTEKVRMLGLQRELAQTVLDRLQAGVVVVDSQQRVHLANLEATTWMAPRSGLRLRHGRICCESPSCDERLRGLISGACSAAPRGGAMRLPRPQPSKSLQVCVLPVPDRHQLATIASNRLALVLVADPECRASDPHLLRSLFGLTLAEGELLTAIASGSSPQEYAARRDLGIATVRTHLRAVMAKCGCNTQAKLVSLARTLPALL